MYNDGIVLRKQLKQHIEDCNKDAKNKENSSEVRAQFAIASSQAYIALSTLTI